MEFEKWLCEKTTFNVSVSLLSLLLGLHGRHNNRINMILLLFKQYVYH